VKTRERHGWGGHCAAAPQLPEGHVSSFFHCPVVGHRSKVIQVAIVGVFLMFRRERERREVGEKIFFFSCLARLGEEEDPQYRSKRHRLGPFFFNQCMKRRRFWAKHVVSFK
jgi:hypothetical protein